MSIMVEPTRAQDVKTGDILAANSIVGARSALVTEIERTGTEITLHVLDSARWDRCEGSVMSAALRYDELTMVGRIKGEHTE